MDPQLFMVPEIHLGGPQHLGGRTSEQDGTERLVPVPNDLVSTLMPGFARVNHKLLSPYGKPLYIFIGNGIQSLFLPLNSGIISVSAKRTFGGAGNQTGVSMCKVCFLVSVPSFYLYIYMEIFFYASLRNLSLHSA